jgi:hypothetical protein
MDEFEIKPKKIKLKNKYILIIILKGYLLIKLGALGKINSESWGGMLLNIGLLIQIIGYILGIIKLLTVKNVRDFLNS